MDNSAALRVQPLTSTEYMGGGSPISSINHWSGVSEQMTVVASLPRSVWSFDLEVDISVPIPLSLHIVNMVGERIYSSDSM